MAGTGVAAIEERHRRAEELWSDLVLVSGAYQQFAGTIAGGGARRAVSRRKRRWSQLMLALYRDGRQVDALRVYDERRALLGSELGLEPGPELQRLRMAILEHDVSLQPRRPSAEVFGATSFVGRVRELAQIEEALATHRLVTLIGIGGVGEDATRRRVRRVARRFAVTMCDARVSVPGAWRLETRPPTSRASSASAPMRRPTRRRSH